MSHERVAGPAVVAGHRLEEEFERLWGCPALSRSPGWTLPQAGMQTASVAWTYEPPATDANIAPDSIASRLQRRDTRHQLTPRLSGRPVDRAEPIGNTAGDSESSADPESIQLRLYLVELQSDGIESRQSRVSSRPSMYRTLSPSSRDDCRYADSCAANSRRALMIRSAAGHPMPRQSCSNSVVLPEPGSPIGERRRAHARNDAQRL